MSRLILEAIGLCSYGSKVKEDLKYTRRFSVSSLVFQLAFGAIQSPRPTGAVVPPSRGLKSKVEIDQGLQSNQWTRSHQMGTLRVCGSIGLGWLLVACSSRMIGAAQGTILIVEFRVSSRVRYGPHMSDIP